LSTCHIDVRAGHVRERVRRVAPSLPCLPATLFSVRNIAVASLLLALIGCGGGSSPAPPPPSYTVGATVSGLVGSGLTLQFNSEAAMTVTSNGTVTFSTRLTSGTSYVVTVGTQPANPAQICTIGSGTGTVAAANVTGVTVTCGFVSWAWVGGTNPVTTSLQNVVNSLGVYGTQGIPASGNVPGSRFGAASWTDSSGNFWMFGGEGAASVIATAALNDLWKFSPMTGQWTWMGGSNTGEVLGGIYGTQGTPATTNWPGSRTYASTWADTSGNLWLFGGAGFTSVTDSAAPSSFAFSNLNDLWKYDTTTGQWTWVGGSNVTNSVGVYGTLGTAATANVPGARNSAASWIDPSGNLWLLGGNGNDTTVISIDGGPANLNDLWKFSPTTGEWTWVSGSNVVNALGVYGTEGTPAAGNVPGARNSPAAWTDAAGNLWLFGGIGNDSVTATTNNTVERTLNDLWRFSPVNATWTWVSGSNVANALGVYGILGSAATGNTPGARESSTAWTDAAGNLWLFGGSGLGTSGSIPLNDLWKFNPDSGQWAWMDGSNAQAQTTLAGTDQYYTGPAGVYGTLGTASPSNIPGGRYSTASWTDSSGNLWLFGGYIGASTEAGANFPAYLNDLWKLTPAD
jgi:Galactose oxidase, central domain/Kelch motif